MLAAALESRPDARLLVVGAGTAQEVVTIAALEPSWRFVAVDPAPAMIERPVLNPSRVDNLPAGEPFNAAMLIGVLHNVPG